MQVEEQMGVGAGGRAAFEAESEAARRDQEAAQRRRQQDREREARFMASRTHTRCVRHH